MVFHVGPYDTSAPGPKGINQGHTDYRCLTKKYPHCTRNLFRTLRPPDLTFYDIFLTDISIKNSIDEYFRFCVSTLCTAFNVKWTKSNQLVYILHPIWRYHNKRDLAK